MVKGADLHISFFIILLRVKFSYCYYWFVERKGDYSGCKVNVMGHDLYNVSEVQNVCTWECRGQS